MGALRQIVDQLGRRHDNRHTRAVINRAGAQIPRIQMRAEQDDFVRLFAALDFGNDILARDRAEIARREQRV